MDADWDNIPKSCLMGLSRKADAEAAIKMSFMISAVLSYLGYMWTGGADKEPLARWLSYPVRRYHEKCKKPQLLCSKL